MALLDVFPTVLEVVDAPFDGPVRGRSLLAARDPARALVSETARLGGLQSLVSGDYKLIRRLRSDRLELYDLARDPREQRDLTDSQPEQAQHMARALAEWERSLRRRDAAEVELTAEELDALRALGYAGADESPDDSGGR